MPEDERSRSSSMRAVGCLLVGSWLCFAASVFLRPNRGEYVQWFDAGLYNVPFGLVAFACLRRATRDPVEGAAWRSLGLGYVAFTVANVYGTLIVGDKDIYPSPADALWLMFYVCVYVAIVQFIRARVTRFYPSTWLDGAIAGLAAAALVVAFALAPVLSATAGRLTVVATNLAYPTVDILLIIALVVAGTAMRTRAVSWWLLAGGMAVSCIGDVLYLFEESAGTYREGGLLDISWPLAAVLVGLGACTTSPPRSEQTGPGQQFSLPLVSTMTAIGLLLYGQRHQLHLVAVGLAVAAIAAATLRTLLTVREVKALAESRREARTDELTGLANRRAFLEHLEVTLSTGASSAVMIIDLDGFKEVNDSLGHDVGDDLLCQVAHRLSSVFGTDQLARLGGDEFGALVSAEDPDDAVATADRVTVAFEDPFQLAGVLIGVRASIGIALSPLHGRRRSELLRFADIAMYGAKRAHSVIEVYDPSRDPNTKERLEVIHELRDTIEARGLELHYQPTIDIASGRVHGVEALVRWPGSDGTLRYPDSFIPLAERSGLIHQLTQAVLEQAITFFESHLSPANPGLRLSVNISGHDFLDEGLATYVGGLLELHSMAADQLTLEITESAVVADMDRAERSISALRNLGVSVSIDDYGVGYSSMAQLVGLTVDELKIDRSFVMRLDIDPRMAAIVRSTVELARALDLRVVAEGVESATSLASLGTLGCDIAQGFHIARPLTPDRLLSFLSTHVASPPSGSAPIQPRDEVAGTKRQAVAAGM